jgi:hypothetical protein
MLDKDVNIPAMQHHAIQFYSVLLCSIAFFCSAMLESLLLYSSLLAVTKPTSLQFTTYNITADCIHLILCMHTCINKYSDINIPCCVPFSFSPQSPDVQLMPCPVYVRIVSCIYQFIQLISFTLRDPNCKDNLLTGYNWHTMVREHEASEAGWLQMEGPMVSFDLERITQ